MSKNFSSNTFVLKFFRDYDLGGFLTTDVKKVRTAFFE